MKQGADVSKAEDNAASNGLAGVPTTEQPIGITHDPAHSTHISLFEALSLIALQSLVVCLFLHCIPGFSGDSLRHLPDGRHKVTLAGQETYTGR